MRRRRNPEIIAGRVNADASIAAGDGFTVQKGLTGQYTVTFTGGFRLISVSGIAAGANVIGLTADTFTERSVRFTALSSSFVGIDASIYFIAVGVQQ